MPTTYIRQKLKDENGNYIITPSMADMVYHADGETVERKYRDLEDRTKSRLSEISLNPKIFGAKGDGETDDLKAFQDMVAYGKANGIKSIKLLPGVYKLSDTFYLPSGWELIGWGKAILKQDVSNSPVIATEEWSNGGGPVGNTKIKDINIVGSMDIGENNHGLLIYDYYTTVDCVYVNGCGGHGIFFTSKNQSGTAPTGTLVENTIKNCQVRKAMKVPYYLGENNNNKLTDGIIQNCMGSGLETSEHILYIGSSAGWFVDNVHTYGKCTKAITLRNGFYTTVSNIYIESFSESAISAHVQNSITLNNISIRLSKDIQDGVNVVAISKSNMEVGQANCSISNLNMITSAFTNRVTGVYIDSIKVKTSIFNYTVCGQSVENVTKIKGYTDNLNYLEDFHVLKPLSESRYHLHYNDKKLKYCDAAKFNGNTEVSLTFNLLEIINYGKIVCDVVISGCAYDNGSLLTSYTSKLMISAKNNDSNQWVVYKLNQSELKGFSVEPTFSANKSTGELTITFTPSDERNTGVVAIDYVAV